ncbi:hypothetical protein TNCV_3075241 [Trichonephila clavipes]|nr:hypothetical protein TNCV_3075241 [Trichonephila clavipes]
MCGEGSREWSQTCGRVICVESRILALIPMKTLRVAILMHVRFVKFQSPHNGLVWKFGEWNDSSAPDPRISSRKRDRCTPIVSPRFKHHTCDSTIWLGSTPILRKNTLEGGQGPSTYLTRGLAARRLFRVNKETNDKITNRITESNREFELPFQENDDPLITVDLSRNKRKDRNDQFIRKDLSRSKNIASNANEDDASRNKSFLKMTSNNFPLIKTQGTSKQKSNEDAKAEIDLERENLQVKCLLRRILVLGNPNAIIRE